MKIFKFENINTTLFAKPVKVIRLNQTKSAITIDNINVVAKCLFSTKKKKKGNKLNYLTVIF